jgi:hypothetical protein
MRCNLGDDMQVDSEHEQNLNLNVSSSHGKKRTSGNSESEGKVNPQVKKIRGKRGLLKQLVEMPLDVLFEVCDSLRFLQWFSAYSIPRYLAI